MLCSGAFRAELTGAIVLQALYVPLLMFVGFFQVCDGASTYTCSCLQEMITCRPCPCSPSCSSAPSDASCLQHQRRTDLSCRCQRPPCDRPPECSTRTKHPSHTAWRCSMSQDDAVSRFHTIGQHIGHCKPCPAAAMHSPADSMCCRVQTSTPPCFEWIKRISYATYGYSALVKNEFQGLGLQPGDDGFDVPDAETLIPANIQTTLSLAANAGVLIAILIGLRTILYIQMRLTIATKAL